MKTCNHCKITKSSDEFYKKSSSKDGLSWWCRDCHKQSMKEKYHACAKNPEYREKERKRIKNFFLSNPEKRAESNKKYCELNRAKINAKLKKRYANKKNRTPGWLTKDDEWMIEQAYELALLRTSIFGFQWHVDHVVPLQGKLVSGLHVPHNLQVIPARDNRSKSNKFAVTT